MMRVLFRMSGGKAPKRELGFGHIYRTINLANELKPNQIFFLIGDFGGVKEVLHSHGYSKNIDYLKNGLSVLEDIQKTIAFIKKKKLMY